MSYKSLLLEIYCITLLKYQCWLVWRALPFGSISYTYIIANVQCILKFCADVVVINGKKHSVCDDAQYYKSAEHFVLHNLQHTEYVRLTWWLDTDELMKTFFKPLWKVVNPAGQDHEQQSPWNDRYFSLIHTLHSGTLLFAVIQISICQWCGKLN